MHKQLFFCKLDENEPAMTRHEFSALDQETQLKTVLDKGFLVATRQDAAYSYTLYLINSFCIELNYQGKELQNIYCVTGTSHLALYTKQQPLKKQMLT